MSTVDLTILENSEPSVWAEQETCEKFSALTVALCAGSTSYPSQFFVDGQNGEFGSIAADLALWVKDYIENSESLDEWKQFLSGVRSELLVDVWGVYDPENLIPRDQRDSVGDTLLGASIFWEFAARAGLTNEEDGPQWASLWFAMIVDVIVRAHIGATPGSLSVNTPLEEPLGGVGQW